MLKMTPFREVVFAVSWTTAFVLLLGQILTISSYEPMEVFRQTNYCRTLPVCVPTTYRAWRDCSNLQFKCHEIMFYFPWWIATSSFAIILFGLPFLI